MNCEQVEERLSAYLDNMLASDERRDVTFHLQTCSRCMTSLAELRQNDILLAQLPPINPSPALRARLFAIPEVQYLAEAAGYSPYAGFSFEGVQPLAPSSPQILNERFGISQTRLMALPGARGLQSELPTLERDVPPTPPTIQLRPSSRSYPTRQYDPQHIRVRWLTPFKLVLTAVLVVVLGLVGFLSLSLRHHSDAAHLPAAIIPPAGPFTGQIPLAAGSRFVFLRNGTLWSTLAEGTDHQPERLTPASVQVAENWVVNPLQGNHDAGDLLAYIDVRGGHVHTVRSDGQQDTSVPLALLRTNSAENWQSATGQAILHSLAWSPDSSVLAFVADPTDSGQCSLYLFKLATGTVRVITTGFNGSVAQPTWSPDGTRLAFTLAHDSVVSVLDYHVQSHTVMDLSNLISAQGDTVSGVLVLNWFSDGGQMAVTWCLGSIGHISSVWMHRVGASATLYPQQLLGGTYLQALYNPGSNNDTGGWLLVTSVAGRPGDILRLTLAGGQPVSLSQGKQVSFVRWSPDGAAVFYLDDATNGAGHAHLINVISGIDQLLPDQAVINPAPDWSADNLQLAYSTGTQIDIVHILNGGQFTRLHLQGQVTNLSWSPSAVHQLIVSLASPQTGLYLVDTRQNTSHQLDRLGASDEIQWTEIP